MGTTWSFGARASCDWAERQTTWARPGLVQAPAPSRCHGSFDKIQMIGEQHPSPGVEQHLLSGRAAALGQSQFSFGF
jgi:hypothetical protein